MFDKATVALAKAASRDGTRPSLQAVEVRPDGTATATNGHVMLQRKIEDLPDGAAGLWSPEDWSKIKVPARAMTNAPDVTRVNGALQVDFRHGAPALIRNMDYNGPYVKWENVIPTGPTMLRLSLGRDALKTLLAAALTDNLDVLDLEIPADSVRDYTLSRRCAPGDSERVPCIPYVVGPMRLRSRVSGTTGVVMPCRPDGL